MSELATAALLHAHGSFVELNVCSAFCAGSPVNISYPHSPQRYGAMPPQVNAGNCHTYSSSCPQKSYL